jgi:hypothetical protein
MQQRAFLVERGVVGLVDGFAVGAVFAELSIEASGDDVRVRPTPLVADRDEVPDEEVCGVPGDVPASTFNLLTELDERGVVQVVRRFGGPAVAVRFHRTLLAPKRPHRISFSDIPRRVATDAVCVNVLSMSASRCR